jgi:hypothetical protein
VIRTVPQRCAELVDRAHATDWWTRAAIRDTLTAHARGLRPDLPEAARLLQACAAWIVATSPVPRTVEHASGVALYLMPAEPGMFAQMLDSADPASLRVAVLIAETARTEARDSARRWWTALVHTLGAALVVADSVAELGTQLDDGWLE